MDLGGGPNHIDEDLSGRHSHGHEPPPSTRMPPPPYAHSTTPRPEYGDPDNSYGNEVSILGQKHDDRPTSFFAQPGILAGKCAPCYCPSPCPLHVRVAA